MSKSTSRSGRSAKPSKAEQAARTGVIATAQAMSARGLTPGRSGNVSCRLGDGFLITPSGRAYDGLSPDDAVRVGPDGAVAPGARPSSEWHLHQAVYAARPDCGAIVHTHSLHATVLACAGRSIPPFHYMVAIAGGADIPCVPYATFGTPELARLVAAGLVDRDACLMAHHGQVAIGATLDQALDLAAEVEVLAEQFVKVLAIGTPVLLSPAAIAEAQAKFAGYRRP